ncbi:MAG: hypothetical protein M3T56_19625 [Chloroflexota bacterium]|nr:hypothetical protein [Chloroflexota bacterium]
MRWLGMVLAAALVACESVAAPSPSPSPSPSQPVSQSPIVAREETPRALLSLAYAPPSVETVGATTSRVGGISPRGPASLAVDENDRIYIWDQARLRVAVFESGKYLRSVPLPYVERSATALLVDGDRFYLRAVSSFSATIEYEIDATTGALLRATTDGGLFPRLRGSVQGPPPYSLGADAAGYAYVLTSTSAAERYERHGAGGALLAYATEPLPLKGIDAYVRADGALYELAADFGGVGSVYVYALLAPAATPPRQTPVRPSSRAPIAFGRPVPDRLTATLSGAGSVDLDARSRMAVWTLASLAKERTDLAAAPQDPPFVARWDDGSRLEIVVSSGLLFADGKIYLGPATAYEQLAAYLLASPSRLAGLSVSGATVRIADLPGVQRVLTTGEIAELRDSISRGFSVSEGELPGVLEHPFPLYEIVLGDVVVRLRGADYGSVGEHLRTGAFAHDGKLDDLVRRWQPVPTLAATDIRSLFLADHVVLDQVERGGPQDITRWKATIVRTLLGLTPSQPESVQVRPFTFTFEFAGGRTETVQVRAGEFTYRGRVVPLAGALNLSSLGGVP